MTAQESNIPYVGPAKPFTRFVPPENFEKIKDILLNYKLTSLELGMNRAALGNRQLGDQQPYPTEDQAKKVSEILSPFYLSIHTAYTITLTSTIPSKIRMTKAHFTILFRLAKILSVKHLTFHSGSFTTNFAERKEKIIERVKKRIKDLLKRREELDATHVELAPEVGGKVNSFADFDTLATLAQELGILFTWDFSHDFARGGNVTKKEGILRRLEKLDHLDLSSSRRLPIHLSGIIVGKMGEKEHVMLGQGSGVPWKLFLSVLKEQNFVDKVNIICESKSKNSEGNSIADAQRILQFLTSDEMVTSHIPPKTRLDAFFS